MPSIHKIDLLCITEVQIKTIKYLKAVLKRRVFNARRKAGCESVSVMLVGRLFQTSGPLTENARRLNCVLVRRTTADLVVDDRS